MPVFVMRDFIGTVQALKNINITPDWITDVVITHSHHDHIECVKYFKNIAIRNIQFYCVMMNSIIFYVAPWVFCLSA